MTLGLNCCWLVTEGHCWLLEASHSPYHMALYLGSIQQLTSLKPARKQERTFQQYKIFLMKYNHRVISHTFVMVYWMEATHRSYSHSRWRLHRCEHPGGRDHGTTLECVCYICYRHFCSKKRKTVGQENHWFIAIPNPAGKILAVHLLGLMAWEEFHYFQIHLIHTQFCTQS